MYWWPRYKHWVSWCGFLHFCRSKYFLIRSLPGIKVLTGNSVWDKKKHGNWQALLGERGMTPLPYPLNIRLQEEVSISNTERIKYPPNIPINFFQIEQSRVFVLPSHCWRKGAGSKSWLLVGKGWERLRRCQGVELSSIQCSRNPCFTPALNPESLWGACWADWFPHHSHH